jgi:hypothetical protein
MRLLELFSGTGSVGEVFRAAGWETVSVDWRPTGPCDIVADILTLDPAAIDAQYGPFDCVWASPPCTEYSVARTTATLPRDLEGADRLVAKALDFIREVRPVVFGEPIHGPAQGSPAYGRAAVRQARLLPVRHPLQEADGDMDELNAPGGPPVPAGLPLRGMERFVPPLEGPAGGHGPW